MISESKGHMAKMGGRITDGIYTSANLLFGYTIIADGVEEVLRAAREQLFLGASQIKIMAGCGDL